MKERKSKLDAHAEQIAGWYQAEPQLTLADCCARLASRGCSVTPSRLSDYLAARRAAELRRSLLAGIVTGSQMARQIDEAFAKNPPPELKLLVGLVKNLVLELNVKGQADPELLTVANSMLKSVLEFAKLEAKQVDLGLAERRVVVLERQNDQARTALTNPELTPAERERRMKEIFGLA